MKTLLFVEKDFNLNKEKLSSFKSKVTQLNLEPIIWKLMNPEEDEGWSSIKAEEICEQYKLFLYLIYAYPKKSIVPTKEIDKFWHTHILDTQLYIEHCFYLFGYYLHHFPYFGIRDKEDKNNLEACFKETVGLFNKYSPNFLLSENLQASGCGDGDDSSSFCTNAGCDSATCTPNRMATDLYSQRPSRFNTAILI